jgi:beta-glucosidase-like glycosyl hydrolase
MRLRSKIIVFLCLANILVFSQTNQVFKNHESALYANNTMAKLSMEKRVSQLLVFDVHPSNGEKYLDDIEKKIKKYQPGGLVIFKTNPKKFVELVNRFQAASEIPLLICIDGEWGLNMRLPEVEKYPYNMTLGAIRDNNLITRMTRQMAEQYQRVGVHVNLAPVVDINNNPDNPVIGFRSFSDNKENVAQKGIAYMKGLQEKNILAVAKHFPGHGNTNVDSHKSLPLIDEAKESIYDFELYPFKKMIEAGVGGVMVGHLSVPSIDPSGTPASLSKTIMTDLLKGELGFDGLVFSDAMNMGGIVNQYKEGEKRALVAGMDVVEYPNDVDQAIKDVMKAMKSGELKEDQINERCNKILMLKNWAKASKDPISLKYLEDDLNSMNVSHINTELFDASTTLLRNENQLLPIESTENIVCLNLRSKQAGGFQKVLKRNFMGVEHKYGADISNDELDKLLNTYDKVIVSVQNTSLKARKRYKLTEDDLRIVNYLSTKENVIFAFFTNPYALTEFKNIHNSKVLIQAYQETRFSYESVVKMLLGEIEAKGMLPYDVNQYFKYGDGIDQRGIIDKLFN